MELKFDEKFNKSSLFSSMSNTLENLAFKCLLNITLLRQKNPSKNTLCPLYTTDCTVFEAKANISVSVPSGAINRPNSIDFYTKGGPYFCSL